MEPIGQLIPRAPDFQPLVNKAAELVNQLSEHIHQINTALYLQGFLHGMALMATILTAIWAFSRKN